MCGRMISGDSKWATYREWLNLIRPIEGEEPELSVSYNVAPTAMKEFGWLSSVRMSPGLRRRFCDGS